MGYVAVEAEPIKKLGSEIEDGSDRAITAGSRCWVKTYKRFRDNEDPPMLKLAPEKS